MALVLGAVLAGTDPVAVTALGRRLALPPRVQVLVQAESLFNDATSLILFRVAVVVAAASSRAPWQQAGGEFALLAGGTLIAVRLLWVLPLSVLLQRSSGHAPPGGSPPSSPGRAPAEWCRRPPPSRTTRRLLRRSLDLEEARLDLAK